MSTSEQAQVRTRMFARALGPFFTIVPTTVAVRGAYMRTLFYRIQGKPHVALVIWRHSADRRPGDHRVPPVLAQPAAIIVSLVGWFLAIRGVLLLTVPQAYNAAGNAVYNSGATAAIWAVFLCLASAGLYLTYVGWKPQPHTPTGVPQ